MIRTLTAVFPLSIWSVLQAIAITALWLVLSLMLIYYPDASAEILSKMSVRSAAVLSRSTPELLRSATLIWAIGIIFVFLDALSCNVKDASLLKVLFFQRHGIPLLHERALQTATLWITFFLAPLLIALNLGQYWLGAEWLVDEDGPLEYTTAVNFLIATVVLSWAIYRQLAGRRPHDHRDTAVLVALAAAMFLVAGEEISWGQRIVGFATPAPMLPLNTQGEFNIHNMFTRQLLESYQYVAAALFAVSCFTCWIEIMDYRPARLRWFMSYLPDPSLVFVFAMMLVISSHIHLNDLVEQLASLVVVLYSIGLVWRRPTL